MFEESARNKRPIHDYDEAEQRLAQLIRTNVASDIVATLTKSVKDYDDISRQFEEERGTYHRRDEGGLATVSEKYRPERQRLKLKADQAAEVVLLKLEGNTEALELLKGFSLNKRSQLSAVRDAVHLIIGVSADKQKNNLGGNVEEMAGANA